MNKTHVEFEVSDTGFFIDCCTPYLGATPDAISNCACCGKGVIEIKCPYCQRSGLPDTDEDTRFCLESENDIRKLRTDHTYYFQVQLQMHVCAVDHADFVVWTEKDIFVERINKDASFVPDKLDTVKYFFIYGVLPELIGKWYTRIPISNDTGIVSIPTSKGTSAESKTAAAAADDDDDDPDKLWCYCNKSSYGKMIMCDNKKCTIKWFHITCLHLEDKELKGKWYCPSCHRLPKFKKT